MSDYKKKTKNNIESKCLSTSKTINKNTEYNMMTKTCYKNKVKLFENSIKLVGKGWSDWLKSNVLKSINSSYV